MPKLPTTKDTQHLVDFEAEMLKAATHAIVDAQRTLKQVIETLHGLTDRIDKKVDKLQSLFDEQAKLEKDIH